MSAAKARRPSARAVAAIKAGVRFRSVIADSNALWEVKSRVRGGWRCECVNEPVTIDGKTYPSDYAGQVKLFTDRDVAAAVGWANVLDGLHVASGDFYAKLLIGDTFHYDNGFGNFVRYRVVERGKAKPIALVGAWKAHDLPRRWADGEITLPHHAKAVLDGEVKALSECPNASSIYESAQYAHASARGTHPLMFQPIDLTVPPLTAAEEAEAKLWKAVKAAKKALDADGTSGAATRLRRAKAIIDAAIPSVIDKEFS